MPKFVGIYCARVTDVEINSCLETFLASRNQIIWETIDIQMTQAQTAFAWNFPVSETRSEFHLLDSVLRKQGTCEPLAGDAFIA
jgi:hypothetical protein